MLAAPQPVSRPLLINEFLHILTFLTLFYRVSVSAPRPPRPHWVVTVVSLLRLALGTVLVRSQIHTVPEFWYAGRPEQADTPCTRAGQRGNFLTATTPLAWI